MKKLIMFSFYALFLLSCTEEGEPTDKFTINVGEQFTIELEANWSTGYSWTWENKDEVSVVDSTSRIYVQSDPGIDGGSGVEKWTFIGKTTGKEYIDFVYQKASSPDSSSIKEKEFLVYVESL